ncbi:NAD(P)H-dependent oxidoreductase subunit E [Aminithiophilus ramosus]|uniref:NAD(P)H-dependent oxidoreductase subunit E n=1 Tax=Aminithiophilus ramosus TaxID=3029084 RepID=A0A9Q7EW64_9BACT|nr:NAD(P)H-dependent oxidoreductase subunit E [Aminithiophilus ramosus]QTX33008.1 NAD(P)H-dependent oxidoreductase subunit E [Aminithiophilus ramosus]
MDTDAVKGILEAYGREERFLLPILQDLQERFRYLPRPALAEVARYLSVSESRVYAVATFYKAFSLTPKGRKSIKVCTGTACHLRGAGALLDALEKELGVAVGGTTADGQFTLETVNCLGACALAPVFTVEDQVYGKSAGRLGEILERERRS